MEKEFELLNNKISSEEKETYITPDIEVVAIEMEQNILAGGSGTTPDMAPVDW
jgi:hypothetical protein